MAMTAPGTPPAGFAAVSRAVVSAAADLVAGMERAMAGEGRVRTAQSNAWDAVLADRARAQARVEVDQLVASLVARAAGRADAEVASLSRDQARVAGASRRPGTAGPARRQRTVGSSPRSTASQTARVSRAVSV